MKQTLIAPKTYRYFTQGNPKKAKTIIYVLHGYGQLAEYFLRKFNSLTEDYFIVAPEGMHRFYLTGNSGRVGASWMTKEERETDISDNITWLNALDQKICSTNQFEKKIVLGFSQGGATAARWFYKGQLKADHLIMWASVFPPDLTIDSELFLAEHGKNHFIIGDNDEFLAEDEQKELIKIYESKGFLSTTYQGKHDISEKVLLEILCKLES